MQKYALVTGASSGMGLEFSIQLAGRGYGIIVVSNRPEENIKAAQTIRASVDLHDDDGNGYVRVIDADLTEADSARKVYDIVKQWNLTVEVLVSNAGMLLFSQLVNTDLTRLDKIINLHCNTPVKLIQLFGNDMKKRGEGYILITSSSTAWMQYPTISHYGATKAFLKNFSRSIWYELRRYGVGVTAVFPGAVDTPLYQLDDSKRRILRTLGIMMTPKKVAQSALSTLFARRYRCIPGVFNKLSIALCACIPSVLLLPLLKIPSIRRLLDSV